MSKAAKQESRRVRNQFLIAVASILAIKEDLRGSKSNLLSEVNVLETGETDDT